MKKLLLIMSLIIFAVPVFAAEEITLEKPAKQKDFPFLVKKFLEMYEEDETPKVYEVKEIKKNSTGEKQIAPMTYNRFPTNYDSSDMLHNGTFGSGTVYGVQNELR